MKSRRLSILWASAIGAALISPVAAADYSGTAGYSFLNLPVGARATAMGEAFTSVPNDVQGLSYNPALLATLIASQISFQHLSYVEDVTQEAVLYGHAGRLEELSWGLSANYLQVGNITRTVATVSGTGDGFTEAGNFSTYDMAMGASVAGPIAEDLRGGATVKFIRESLADASANAGAVDLGLLYKLNDDHSWNLGGAIQNLGFSSKFADASVPLPWTLRGGLSGQPFAQWVFSTDFVKRQDTKGQVNVGAEVTPRRIFSLRLGYDYALTRPDLGGLAGFSAGVGLRFQHMSLDYAFVPLGDLGTTHHISFNYHFVPKGL